MSQPFFEGKHFSVDLEKARTFARLYKSAIVSREWFTAFLTQIDMYVDDHPGKYSIKEDGTLKNPSNIIHTWIRKHEENSEAKATQKVPETNTEQIRAEQQEMEQHPDRFVSKEEGQKFFKKLANRIGSGGRQGEGVIYD